MRDAGIVIFLAALVLLFAIGIGGTKIIEALPAADRYALVPAADVQQVDCGDALAVDAEACNMRVTLVSAFAVYGGVLIVSVVGFGFAAMLAMIGITAASR